MELLARVRITATGRELVLAPAGWVEPTPPLPDAGARALESEALARVLAAWEGRAGYLPLAAQVQEAAEAAAGLEVAYVKPEPPRLMDVLY